MRIEDFIMTDGRVSPGKAFSWGIVIIFFFIVLVNMGRLFERNSSGIYQVRQSYWGGNLSTRFEPGFYFQGLADLTDFKAASSYKFSDKPDAENVSGPPIVVRFNDGGRAKVYGDARFVLPRNDDDMARIKLIFDNQEGLMKELYSQIVKEAVVMTAALMSSEESYSSLRSQFSDWAGDQVMNGIYIVEKKIRKVPSDENPEKLVPEEYVDIKRDSLGVPVRKETVLKNYNIALQQFIIEDIVYLDGLDSLIGKKREFLTEVIKVKARAEKALQERKTAESNGKKKVAEARYNKLREKEKVVLDYMKKKEQMLIEAKKNLTVAKENKQAAYNRKLQLIAQGKGEAEARRLALLADGALGMKEKYYREAWAAYKNAFSTAKLVPSVTTIESYRSSSSLPPGVEALFQIDKMLRQELGLKLTF